MRILDGDELPEVKIFIKKLLFLISYYSAYWRLLTGIRGRPQYPCDLMAQQRQPYETSYIAIIYGQKTRQFHPEYVAVISATWRHQWTENLLEMEMGEDGGIIRAVIF